MIFIYGITLSAFVLVVCSASNCEDQNIKGCQRLAAIKQDMCQDNCLATLCPRTCGLCPLKCYSCEHVDHPSDCNQTVQCGNMSMSCIVSQTVTTSLEKKFQLGCVDTLVCNDLFGVQPQPTQSKFKRDVDLVGGCCSSDLCNKSEEPDKITLPTTIPVQPSGNTNGFSSACFEKDTEVCRYLSENNGCILSCVASMCPQTCGKCSLTCYECASVDLPGNCRNRITCNGNEESCIAVESHVFNFKEGYKLGCVAKQNCKDLLAMNIEGVCCDNNFCNGNYIPTTTLIPLTSTLDTTTASAQSQLGLPTGCTPSFKHEHNECPSKFVRKGQNCYFVGQHARTRHDAMNVCKYLCSRLVIISSKVENLAISQLLSQQRHQANRYWLDAYRNSSSFSGPWHWRSTGDILRRHTYSHWRPGSHDQTKPDGEHCASIGKAESGDSDNGYYWDHRSCTIHAPAICEYPLGHKLLKKK
ncbi:uncharacterized protein LOC134681447 isoform X2 [Mytilus trossulus]|uniref:uncharacterized protein LOC134681447 isoform X2 n=1 Tax=Mytilus trossulus TaxID=6551 RepID=UPI0030074F60